MSDSLLEQLPDIDLPAEIGIWPLAPGWYVVIALLCIFIAMYVIFLVQRARQLRPRKLILKRLAELQSQQDAVAVCAEVSSLLRRAALISFPRDQVAGLQGEQWLSFLDTTGKTTAFTQGVGRALVSVPYQRQADIPISELVSLVMAWVSLNVHRRKE